jgi:hypothetical protein
MAHQKLQKQHRLTKGSYVRLASHPGAGDDAFRNVLAALEAEDGTDLVLSLDAGNIRINKVSYPH